MAASDSPILVTNDSIVEEINRLGKRAMETGSPADAFAHSQLLTTVAPSNQLPEVVTGVYENLLQVGLVGDSDEKVFANAGVHIFQREARSNPSPQGRFSVAAGLVGWGARPGGH